VTLVIAVLALIAGSQRGVNDASDFFARRDGGAGAPRAARDAPPAKRAGEARPAKSQPPPPVTPLDPARAAPAPNVKAPGQWVRVSPGTFTMGSPVDEPGRNPNEAQHEVTLTRPFLIQTMEVTQGQFQDTMGYNPSEFAKCGRDCPVEQVSWNDAAAYCNALSKRESLEPCYSCEGQGIRVWCSESEAFDAPYDCPGYRLPTEAEWELAARAGATTALYTGAITIRGRNDAPELEAIAWFLGNSRVSYPGGFDCAPSAWRQRALEKCGPHPVGKKQRNRCGLHDVVGNVWEWCHDWYAVGLGDTSTTDPAGPEKGIGRVFRGGSWDNDAASLRVARRNGGAPGSRYVDVGFRPVRTATP
jgi:formylglycine-generating enzyme required for sulfatase activity